MKRGNKKEWVEKGYKMVSESSFTDVNIESISRAVNKNKSSFYNYFGDWEGFEEELLNHHKLKAKQFGVDVKKCQNIIPETINLFIEYQIDVFFHKNLRINREKAHYQKCFESVHAIFKEAILDKWSTFIHLEGQYFLATKFLKLISENFLLQITDENYNYRWMENYFLEISKLLFDLNPRVEK
ncbi:MAG: hypothetical protein ACI85B_002257 [Flavobacteriaceae bacterium]|jgi:hypothetical protein